MAESCDAISGAGSSSAPTHGSRCFADCSFVMNIFSLPGFLLSRLSLDHPAKMFMEHAVGQAVTIIRGEIRADNPD